MKAAIFGLIGLGLVAAACAALLVTAVRAGTAGVSASGGAGNQDIQILIANQPLRMMSVVEGTAVSSKTLPRAAMPPGAITDPVQVVGRVLMVPMVEGQAFTQNCFAMESSGAHLAAALPKGKRAMGISVTDYGGLEGLLYPGCTVDVLLSLKPSEMGTTEGRRSAISTTLLVNVEVLAIERQSIVSGTSDKVGNDVESAPQRPNSRRVTLLVDSHQAKSLQLAMDQGTLSLALRNPLDASAVNDEKVSMRQILGEKEEDEPSKPSWGQTLIAALVAAGQKAPAPAAAVPPAAVKPPQWEMLVLRGDTVETRAFPLAKDGTQVDALAATARK